MVVKKTSKFKPKTLLSFLDYSILFYTLVLIFGAGFILFQFQDEFQEIRNLQFNSVLGSVLFYFTAFLLIFKISFLAFLLVNYLKYKPVEAAKDVDLPTVTIIVPAYNEGAFVFHTLKSIAESNFPMENIQLIAIDDGSKDDTWDWMLKAKDELGDFLSIYQQPENKGKRHALYRGFNLATGEVIVTIDSDSLIYKNTLRNLVSPFVVNERCGAVAGNVKIQNTNKAIIPKMLNVSFAFSFGFIRAAQGNMKSVLCTPGALAAYRKDAVMNCLDEWINQTFMGVKTDIGEDRAMTNMIMKQGYDTMFQSNASVATNIPENYTVLRKMFTRWERSNVRENIMMSKFAFKKFRPENRLRPRVLLVNQWLTVITAYPALILMILSLIFYPMLFLCSTIVSIALFSIIPAVYYAVKNNKRNSLWIFTYNLFYFFTLFWITPYAIVTANRRGWLTRENVDTEVQLVK
ncbi:glycosyltransferase [Brumimicrobium aurantiacum]|uniref:Glycosyltransferase family 2 protein n=1 Tax=Brumimicrobium aurantiacum TaxID=1737063 RepID=A0A3E1EY69_9FLAO|nr:glycosyltransferase [Brumimicrobium aurantiacum]RFC54496.1 glycosyltransferase family 2 protein [Brumimicrobium aurantiacum]